MSHCQVCGAKFRFADMLKAMNPANIKCGGCDNRIKSSHLFLFSVIAIFCILMVGIFALIITSGQKAGFIIFVGLGVLVGFAFEFGYFIILDKGVLNSNLDYNDANW